MSDGVSEQNHGHAYIIRALRDIGVVMSLTRMCVKGFSI